MPEAVKFSLRHPIRTLSLLAAERKGLQKVGKGLRIAAPFASAGALATAFVALTGHPEGLDIAVNALLGLALGEGAARSLKNSFSRAFVLGRSEREIGDLKTRHTALLKRFESVVAELEESKARVNHTMVQLEFQSDNAAFRVQTKIPTLGRIERLIERAVADIKGLSSIVKDEKVSPRIQSWLKLAEGEVDIFNWQRAAIREEIDDLQVVADKIGILKRTGSQLPADGYMSVDTVERTRRWQGGMGETEVMFHLHGGVFVIRKKLLPQYAENAELSARFIREAKIAERLDHPNIARGFGYGENVVEVTRDGRKSAEKQLYLMTEFVRGRTLDEIIYSNSGNPQLGSPLPPKQAAAIALQVLSALEYMHSFEYSTGSGQAMGLVHRDLKPGNVMISIDRSPEDVEYVKVIDLGLAREMISGAGMTQTGSTLGTPEFMAPEQLRGEKQMTGMVDIYALALIMYEMFEGRNLFTGFERPDVTVKIMTSRMIPQGLKEIMIGMLHPRKEQRPSHSDIREALEQTVSVLEATRFAG